jgi:peptide/nickel transport system substrate-binding protein
VVIPLPYGRRHNPEVDKLVERQSTESDIEKRKRLVCGDRTQAGRGRCPPYPVLLQKANRWRPQLKGLTTMANSVYNSWRFDNLWLDN